MKYFPSIFIVLIVLFSMSITHSQEKNILNKLQNKFKSINNLSADFTQYTGSKKNLEGKFFYKKENHLRLDFNNVLIVTDGITSWNYNRKQKKIIISNYDENDPSSISLKKIIIDYPSKCVVTESTETGTPVIELKPETNSGINAQLIRIWINSDNLIQKVIIKSDNDSELEFRFSGYKINPALSASEFTFNPPEGIKVIDLR